MQEATDRGNNTRASGPTTTRARGSNKRTSIARGDRRRRARGSNKTDKKASSQREEEHGVMESKWRKTRGVMIPAIALVDCG